MRCLTPLRLVLTPTLLGRDGVRRAFTLVAVDRPTLTLDAWIAESGANLPLRDRLLAPHQAMALPPRGLVGLTAPTGCLFAVFGYAVEAGPAGPGRLAVRGPSWHAPMGGRLVPEGIDETIIRLAAELGCAGHDRRPW